MQNQKNCIKIKESIQSPLSGVYKYKKKNQNKKPQTIDQVLEIGNPVHQQRMHLCLYYYKY